MKSTFIIKLCLCVVASFALVACGTINEKRKIDYRATRPLPPLDVPPDLSSVPDAGQPGSVPTPATYSALNNDKKNPSAEQSSVLPQIPEMRIDRDGQTRWLVVRETPQALWPRVREFVSSSGLVIDRENPVTGVIETDWTENHAKVGDSFQRFLSEHLGSLYSSSTKDKFRIRLENGVESGTTEVYISHRGMEEIYAVNTAAPMDGGKPRWQSRPPDPEIEIEMLRQLTMFLGKSEQESKTIVASVQTQLPDRARIVRDGDLPKLNLDDAADRAWRRVGLSLDRIGFTVEDRDRSKGIYYVRYIDPDKADDKPGFFARMFGADEKKDREQYQVHLQPAASGTDVMVKTKDGAPETGKTGERILSLLLEQLK